MRLNTLGEMASGIAHELNQPLAAIANYIRGCERRMHENACTIDENYRSDATCQYTS